MITMNTFPACVMRVSLLPQLPFSTWSGLKSWPGVSRTPPFLPHIKTNWGAPSPRLLLGDAARYSGKARTLA